MFVEGGRGVCMEGGSVCGREGVCVEGRGVCMEGGSVCGRE